MMHCMTSKYGGTRPDSQCVDIIHVYRTQYPLIVFTNVIICKSVWQESYFFVNCWKFLMFLKVSCFPKPIKLINVNTMVITWLQVLIYCKTWHDWYNVYETNVNMFFEEFALFIYINYYWTQLRTEHLRSVAFMYTHVNTFDLGVVL